VTVRLQVAWTHAGADGLAGGSIADEDVALGVGVLARGQEIRRVGFEGDPNAVGGDRRVYT
jgi:hypothetical protein